MSSETETGEVVNFGKSIIVPSVQELSKQPVLGLPPRYVHTDDGKGQLSPAVSGDSSPHLLVPVIDVRSLGGGDSAELGKLHCACRDWGFFQVLDLWILWLCAVH